MTDGPYRTSDARPTRWDECAAGHIDCTPRVSNVVLWALAFPAALAGLVALVWILAYPLRP